MIRAAVVALVPAVRTAAWALGLGLWGLSAGANPSAPAAATQDPWSTAVAQRLAAAGSATGLVALRIDADGRVERLMLGTRAAGGSPVDRSTRFEIGSITKALTGELLAALAADGTLAATDTVERHVAELRGTPAGAVTLQALATHTAGLPRVPMSSAFWLAMLKDPDDPYATYGQDALVRDLRGWRPDTGDGAPRYAYSNYGYALLGLAIERASGQPYRELLTRHLLAPAGAGTAEVPSDAAAPDAALAQGHDAAGRPVPPWRLGAFAAAGGVRADADAMQALIDAARRGAPPMHRGAAMARAARGDGAAGLSVGLGWHRTERHGDRIVWHNGGTGGFRSFAGWSEVSGRAVVLMANGHVALDDLGLAALNAGFPVGEVPPAPRRAPAWLLGVVGAVGLSMLLALARWARLRPRPDLARVDPAPAAHRLPGRPAGSALEVVAEAVAVALGVAILWQLGPRLGVSPVVVPLTALAAVVAVVALGRTLRRLPAWPAARWGRRALGWRVVGAAVAGLVLAWLA